MYKVVKEFDLSDSQVDVVEIFKQIDTVMAFNKFVLASSDMTTYKGQYNEIIWSYLIDLVEVEKIIKEYYKLEYDSYMKISNGDYRYIPPNQIHFDSPTHDLSKLFNSFAMQSIIIVRKVYSVFDKMYPEAMKAIKKNEQKAKTRARHCSSLMRSNSIFAKFFQHTGWIKELYDIRGDIEHTIVSGITRFDVEVNPITREPSVILPELVSNKKLVRDYMTETFKNLYSFCIDFPIMLFSLEIKEEVHVIAVKAENNRGSRFEVENKKRIELKGS